MFSVIFEVKRKPDKQDEYLKLAMGLKPILQAIDGFIHNERFESVTNEGWLLSHTTWRDEKSVVRWRTEAKHHETQEKGRFEIFEDYPLRVGEIVADSSPPPSLSVIHQRLDESEIGPAKYASLTELFPAAESTLSAQADALASHLGLEHASAAGLLDHQIYRSISAIYPDAREYTKGKMALLATWTDIGAARAWAPKTFGGLQELRHRIVRVVRDYGMFDRREAPQYYDDVGRPQSTQHAN